MAMIKCRECGASISSKAQACPHCGATQKSQSRGCLAVVIAIPVLFILLVVLGGEYGASTPSVTDPAADRRTTQAIAAIRAMRDSLRDPDSFVLETLYSNADATTLCMQYRARNGLGGMNRAIAVFNNSKTSDKVEDWNRLCTHNMHDMSFVKHSA